MSAFALELGVSASSVQRWESQGAARLKLHGGPLGELKRLHRKTLGRRR